MKEAESIDLDDKYHCMQQWSIDNWDLLKYTQNMFEFGHKKTPLWTLDSFWA